MLVIEFKNEVDTFMISDNISESISLKIIEEYINFKNNNQINFVVKIGYNECLIYSFRLAVKNNLINHYEIIFIFEENEISINKEGKLSNYPSNFCNIGNELLSKL